MGGAGTLTLTAIIVLFGLAQNWLMSGQERREKKAIKPSAKTHRKEVFDG